MHSIKITALSCFLLCSFASYSSFPAHPFIDPDELEIPEIHLIPKKVAHNELEQAIKDLRSFAKESQNKDLVKKVHQAFCASEKRWADWQNAQDYIENCGQQEIAQGLRDEVQTFKTLYEQQGQQWDDLVDKSKGDPDQLWSVFCLESRQRNIYIAQAVLLRVEKEEGLQRECSMQIQIQQQTAQIQQQTAEINHLRAALRHQALAAQSIAASGVASQERRHGLAEMEDVFHQTPPPPYAQ